MVYASQPSRLSLVEIIILLLVVGGIGGGLYWWFKPGIEEISVQRFQPHINDYLAAADKIFKEQDGYESIPVSHKGKVLAIDVQQITVDAIHFMLPDRIRADVPGDVTLLVLVDCKKHQVGKFGLSDAYSIVCDIRAFDLKLAKLLWRSNADRSPPTRANPIPFVDFIAERPNADIVELLTQSVNLSQ